jgi:hypothetical protein
MQAAAVDMADACIASDQVVARSRSGIGKCKQQQKTIWMLQVSAVDWGIARNSNRIINYASSSS